MKDPVDAVVCSRDATLDPPAPSETPLREGRGAGIGEGRRRRARRDVTSRDEGPEFTLGWRHLGLRRRATGGRPDGATVKRRIQAEASGGETRERARPLPRCRDKDARAQVAVRGERKKKEERAQKSGVSRWPPAHRSPSLGCARVPAHTAPHRQ